MRTLYPDKSWLCDTIKVELYQGEGDYNIAQYSAPLFLTMVHVDMTKSFTGVGDDRTITANATIFLIAKYTTNYPTSIDDSWLQARLTVDGHEYKVVDWSRYDDPDTGKPFSVELKVI